MNKLVNVIQYYKIAILSASFALIHNLAQIKFIQKMNASHKLMW